MYVKFPLVDLNSGSCPPHPTCIYTCRVTTVLRVRSGHTHTHLGVHIYEFLINKSTLIKIMNIYNWMLAKYKLQSINQHNNKYNQAIILKFCDKVWI